MARISIELPEDLKAKVEVRAAESGHRDVGAYIESLIRADADDASEDPGAPAHLTFSNREELEAIISERLEGGPSIEVTPQFWKSLRPSAFPDRPKPRNEQD
jgi:hypothetical protein